MEFKDITSELYRVYTFPSGAQVRIDEPKVLNVSKSGGHRVLDNFSISHYIPSGWIHLEWRAKPGTPNFVL